MAGRSLRDEEGRRGKILRRKREREIWEGYLGYRKKIKRDRKMVI